MDFAKINTLQYHNRPQFLQFKHPVYGHLLFADGDDDGRKTDKSVKPFGLLVKSNKIPEIKKLILDYNSGLIEGDINKIGYETMIVSYVNWPNGGDIDALLALFNETPEFVDQYNEFVNALANFFGKPAVSLG